MTVENRKKYIRILRDNEFNCFPIPKYPDSYDKPKAADSRYQGAATKLDQEIKDSDNYGYMGQDGKGNGIVDFDSKIYESQVLEIAKEYMVIKTANGFHLPVIGLTDNSEKVELFDLTIQDKKIIEIQGIKQYVMGIGSEIFHEKLKVHVEYENIGTDKILNVNSTFEKFVKQFEEKFKVSRKAKRQDNYKMRKRFEAGKIPQEGTSNKFYFLAAQHCLSKGISRQEAINKIELNFNEYVKADYYNGRSWSDIETAINTVYDDPDKWLIKHGGNNKSPKLDDWKDEFFGNRKIFSDIGNKILYENRDGFLANINNQLLRELVANYRDIGTSEFNNIKLQLLGEAQPVPEKDNDRIVFPNGTFRPSTGKIEDTDLDKLAFLGFEDFEYIENPQCPKFQDVIFSGVPKEQHPQIKAGLKAIFQPKLDSRISVMYGLSGSGKSTGLSILGLLLKENTLMIRPSTFADDPFLQAKIKDKLLVVFLDMPKDFDSYMNLMKTFTGESNQTVRGFHKDAEENLKIIAKFWGATNNLFSIPEHEKDPMFNRRLSLITKDIPKEPYPEDNDYAEKIVKEEGSHIISWILNLTDEECQYESKKVLQPLWESFSEPERRWIENNFTMNEGNWGETTIVTLVKEFAFETGSRTTAKQMINLLKYELGYPVSSGCVRGLVRKRGLNY